jgi:endonuclease YncB( thermonuclease family)
MKRFIVAAVALLIAASVYAAPQPGELISGTVVAVSDGDTLTLLTPDKQQIKVRLAEIDAPEKAQPFGTRAKQMLSELVFGKQAEVLIDDIDRYGRTVGRVYVGQIDVNAEMVQRGGAWVYRQYSHDPLLLKLEQSAKSARRGLWGLPASDQIPPWEWRRSDKKPTAAPPAPTVTPPPQLNTWSPPSGSSLPPSSYSRPYSSGSSGSSSGSGRCMRPDDVDSRGRRCGKRAASERPGGR